MQAQHRRAPASPLCSGPLDPCLAREMSRGTRAQAYAPPPSPPAPNCHLPGSLTFLETQLPQAPYRSHPDGHAPSPGVAARELDQRSVQPTSSHSSIPLPTSDLIAPPPASPQVRPAFRLPAPIHTYISCVEIPASPRPSSLDNLFCTVSD